MSDDTKWSAMKIEELRIVAKKYKAFHSLGNISKASKGALIDTLKKFMSWEGENLKQKTSATPITVEKVAPKAKKAPAPKAPPQAPPAPAVATGDKGYKKKVVARKVIQAREASVNAEAIAEQAKAMGHSITEHKKMMDDREKQVQKKGKAQARRAVGDAMAIKPPKMEEEKKSSEKEVKVKDIVRAKMDDKIYYRNRYYDNSVAYGIVKNKVMIIGKAIEDYNDLELFDKPKEIPSNVRFYNDDDKPIKTLNDLQETGSSAPPKAPKASSAPPKAPPAPAVATGDKSYKKKVVAKKVVQARGASADARDIVRGMEIQKDRELNDKYRELEEEKQDLEAQSVKEWSKNIFLGEPQSVEMKKIMKRLEEIEAEKKLLKKGIMPSKATPTASSAPASAPAVKKIEQYPLEEYKKRTINMLTSTFYGKAQLKKLTKFVDEKIFNESNLLNWLMVFHQDILGSGRGAIKWINDIKRDVFGGNEEEYQKLLKRKPSKVDLKEWEAFVKKIITDKQIQELNFNIDMYD